MKDKIPFYEIVNKFFVGAVFTIFFVIVTADKLSLIDLYNKYAAILKDWSVLVATILLIAMYEIGFIINRAGSAFIAPLLEKTKIWPKEEYDIDISEIKETNKTFKMMITENVLSRSQILLFLILQIIALVYMNWQFVIAFLPCIIVLVFAGRKHSKRINKIRKAEAERKGKEKKETKEIKEYLGIGTEKNNDTAKKSESKIY